MEITRKSYLLIGSDDICYLEDKIAKLWSFGYRPHGSLVHNQSNDLYNLIQPLVYDRNSDERIGEELESDKHAHICINCGYSNP